MPSASTPTTRRVPRRVGMRDADERVRFLACACRSPASSARARIRPARARRRASHPASRRSRARSARRDLPCAPAGRLRASTSSVAASSSSEKRDMWTPALSGRRSATIVKSPLKSRSSPSTLSRMMCLTDDTPTRLSDSRTSGASSCRLAKKCIARCFFRDARSARAPAASSPTVCLRRGSTWSGAISASGTRLNGRSSIYGCGTSKRPKSRIEVVEIQDVDVDRPRAELVQPLAADRRFDRPHASSNASGSSAVVNAAATLRNVGPRHAQRRRLVIGRDGVDLRERRAASAAPAKSSLGGRLNSSRRRSDTRMHTAA